MVEIYDLNNYRIQKEQKLMFSLNISEKHWKVMKLLGFNPMRSDERENFYKGLENG